MNIFKRIGGYFISEEFIQARTRTALSRAGITRERLEQLKQERIKNV